MNIISNIAMVLLVPTFLAGCDQALNKVGAEYLKISLKDTCGDEDPDCIAAVDTQFDSCHSKYEQDWNNYMNSSSSKEDELLEIYSKGLFACIVDQDGDSYFVFDPE